VSRQQKETWRARAHEAVFGGAEVAPGPMQCYMPAP